jgi:hypothetical protein
MTKKRKNILLLSVLLVLLFLSLDLLLARYLIRHSDRTFRAEHYYYHHGLIPNQAVLATWFGARYPFFTNSLGFRDREIREIPLETSKRRILFMGDSHTEGVGLRFQDTFTGQLLEKIDTATTEILNAASVSYSPRIYYLKTKYLIETAGLKFDELFVFIDLSDIQNEIVYENYNPREMNKLGKSWFNTRRMLVNRSFTLHTLSNFRQARETRRFLKKSEIFDEYRDNESHVVALDLYATFFSGFDDKTLLSNPLFHGVGLWMYDDEFVELTKKGLEIGGQNMEKLIELCKKHNIPVTISVHPWPTQIKVGNTEDMYVRFWKEFAEKHQVEFLNLYHTFLNPQIPMVLGVDLFIPGDNHWNRNGNMLVARELEKRIVKSD